jgi:hypothetical protein
MDIYWIKTNFMRKIIKLTRQELVEQIRKSITKNLYEADYSTDVERSTQPREFQLKDIFGPKYSRYIPNDVIRNMRKNPSFLFEKLYDVYGEKAFEYLEKARDNRVGSSSSMEEPMMEAIEDYNDFEDFGDDEEDTDYVMEKVKEVVDGDGEFDESDIDDIFNYDGNIRQFRGSIYIDGVVPETEDKEFDRKAAMKVMEFFAKKTDANQYVGGVGFKRRDITNPFDKDF